MQTETSRPEIPFRSLSGWPMLGLILVIALTMPILLLSEVLPQEPQWFISVIVLAFVAFVMLFGFFIVNPNTARVLVLFGRYRGTERRDGLHWTNPFTMRHKISLKAHNLNGQ